MRGTGYHSMDVDMKKFDVAIHNKLVREALENFEPNKTVYSDDWADTHYFEINAESKEEAITVMKERYPEEKGFVIVDVVVLTEF